MKFNIVCDESSVGERFLVIGAVTIPRVNHAGLAVDLNGLKAKLGFREQGEIKWRKVSRAYSAKYCDLAGWFFEQAKANTVTFRAHVIDTSSPHYRPYGNNDLEHSFYKAYFHVLYQSVIHQALDDEGSNILILMDDKKNRHCFHLDVIKRGLNLRLFQRLRIPRLVANVEPRSSSGVNAEPFIQIVDLLIGAIAYERNGNAASADASPWKTQMVRTLESMAGTQFKFDTSSRAPFNIFTFDTKIALERRRQHRAKRKAALAPSLISEAPFQEPHLEVRSSAASSGSPSC